MSPFEKFAEAFTSPKAFFFYLVSLLLWVLLTAAITIASSFMFTHYIVLGFGFGTAAWVFVMGRIFRYFTVSVPEVTGLVTVDLLTGNMHTYGTGLKFRSPTEQVKEGNFINLRTMKTDDKQETFPCKDGPVVQVKWSSQYKTSVEQLSQYITVDEEIINKGINEVTSSFLALKIRGMNSEAIRGVETKSELEQSVLEHFRNSATVPMKDEGGIVHEVPIEKAYGIKILMITIADVDFEVDYQKARSADQVMKKYKETADAIAKGDGSISNKDALDNVLMVAGQGIKKNISQETKVFDASPRLLEAVGKLADALLERK